MYMNVRVAQCQVRVHVLTAIDSFGRAAEPCWRMLFRFRDQTEALTWRSSSWTPWVYCVWSFGSRLGIVILFAMVHSWRTRWNSFAVLLSIPSSITMGSAGKLGLHCASRLASNSSSSLALEFMVGSWWDRKRGLVRLEVASARSTLQGN
jgi:hypothetical protein